MAGFTPTFGSCYVASLLAQIASLCVGIPFGITPLQDPQTITAGHLLFSIVVPFVISAGSYSICISDSEHQKIGLGQAFAVLIVGCVIAVCVFLVLGVVVVVFCLLFFQQLPSLDHFRPSSPHSDHDSPPALGEPVTPSRSKSAVSQPTPGISPTPIPLPRDITLTTAIQMPIVVRGKPSGSIMLPPGTRLELVSVGRGTVVIRYFDSTATIPTTATNLLLAQPAKK